MDQYLIILVCYYKNLFLDKYFIIPVNFLTFILRRLYFKTPHRPGYADFLRVFFKGH